MNALVKLPSWAAPAEMPDATQRFGGHRLAVLVPCYNEAATVGEVVRRFLAALPEATVYVYDNNSTDGTVQRAREAGAVVRTEPHQGKGNVVRRMFADVEADVYVIVDGDNTYDAQAAPQLIDQLIGDGLDFVNGARVESARAAYRPGHRFGNVMLSSLVRSIFGREFNDMLSGYKVFSRRYVKSFPAMSSGFEIETELTIHALELRMPCGEVTTDYGERPEGSQSKLRTFRDGWRILTLIFKLVREERPLQFFGLLAAGLMLLSLVLGAPLMWTYLETGLVPRFPTAILASALGLMAGLSFALALILDLSTMTRREMKRLVYLSFPSAHAGLSPRAELERRPG